MRTSCGFLLTCMACEKGMYEECLADSVTEDIRTSENVLGKKERESMEDFLLYDARFISAKMMITEDFPVEQKPYKITQNNDWRGNGKQRARPGYKGKYNGRSR